MHRADLEHHPAGTSGVDKNGHMPALSTAQAWPSSRREVVRLRLRPAGPRAVAPVAEPHPTYHGRYPLPSQRVKARRTQAAQGDTGLEENVKKRQETTGRK